MSLKHIYLLVTIILLLFKGYSCERLHELIYSSIEGSAACFRRLNGTHQTGCSTSDKGAVGVVHFVQDHDDVLWLATNASAGPYMAVVSTSKFGLVEFLIDHPTNIAGVLTYENASDIPSFFTHDTRCPNEFSSADGNQCSSSKEGGVVWNEKGTGLLKREIPFPIFFIPESRYEEIEKINHCFGRFNYDKNNQRGRSLCSIQLNSFMFAAINTEVCMRRSATSTIVTTTKVCDPLGDQNVYYSLFPRTKESKKQSITLVTARIDSASLFDGVSPGAASSVVGLVTLISAAAALAQLIPVSKSNLYETNILWTLFNGEAFDYIGSQRVAYDIKRGVWPPNAPLAPTDVKLHVEIGQIGGSLSDYVNENTWPLNAFVPTLAPSTINDGDNDIQIFLKQLSNAYNMTIPGIFNGSLPPSSIHSFRRILSNVTESGEMLEMLLVDHKETFTNVFYNSALDDSDKIAYAYKNISMINNVTFISTAELIADGLMKETDTQVKISRLATALAHALYQRVVGEAYTGNITVSAHLVDEMLYCFLKNETCKLLSAAEFGGNEGPREGAGPAPLYVGVTSWNTVAPVFAGHLLALLTGTQLSLNKSQCETKPESGYTRLWLKGWNHNGVCIETTMNFSQALSPAFIISDYDFKSGTYSTWTESVWQTMWARVFVSASGGSACVAAATGAVSTLIAALLTFWLRRHSSLIFVDPPSATIVVDDAASGILRSVNC